jgi:hypothetical protein
MEYLSTLGAGLLAVFLEMQYRSRDSFEWWYLPIYLVMSLLLWHAIKGGPTLVIAVAGFNLVTLVARAGISNFILGEPIVKGNLAAVALLGAAVVIGKVWR